MSSRNKASLIRRSGISPQCGDAISSRCSGARWIGATLCSFERKLMAQLYRAAVVERRPFVRVVLSTWSLPRPSVLGFFRLAYGQYANSCRSEKRK
jgi:hypothetical protein